MSAITDCGQAILRLLTLQGPIVLPHDPRTSPLLLLHPQDADVTEAEPLPFSLPMLSALQTLSELHLATFRVADLTGPKMEHYRWWVPQYGGLCVATEQAWAHAREWPGVLRAATANLSPAEHAAWRQVRNHAGQCLVIPPDHERVFRRLASRRLIEIMGRPGQRVAALLPLGR